MIMIVVICVFMFSAFTFWACCAAGKWADEAMEEINKKQSEIER